MTEISEAMDRLKQLNRDRDDLYRELDKSLALQGVWFDAFEYGRCKSRIVGNPRDSLTFNLTLGNGEERSLPLEEVPVILWSDQVKADIRQLGPFHSKYYKLLKEGEDNA